MNVLVTGGTGFIGSHTCVELLEKGHDVVIIDNLVNSSPKVVDRIRTITGRDVTFYKEDVRNRKALDEIFEKHNIGCAIHFAGLKAVGESVRMPLEYYDNNLNSTITLCEAMRDHNCKNIIFSSSATVYDSANKVPLKETDLTGNCTNPYGWTKYMSEQIMRDTAFADESRSCGIPPLPMRNGPSRCCVTSTPSGPIPPDSSERIPGASPTTSCPTSPRWPWDVWTI